MANESTNDWIIENYREVPYWDIPFAVMADSGAFTQIWNDRESLTYS